MPRTAPTTIPIPTEPAAQPINAPARRNAAVVPKSTPPAPASWKLGRGAGSIGRAQHTNFVTVEFRSASRVVSPLVTRLVLVHGSVGNAEMTWGQVVEPMRERY